MENKNSFEFITCGKCNSTMNHIIDDIYMCPKCKQQIDASQQQWTPVNFPLCSEKIVNNIINTHYVDTTK